MVGVAGTSIDARYQELSAHFPHWEKIKDLIDQCIDMMLNYRQSGHPGGSRSKVHALVVTLLSRRDALGHPPSREAFRRPLRAGRRPLRCRWSTATLAVFNEALRAKYERDRRRALSRAEGRRAPTDLGGPAASSAAMAACPVTPRWRARRSSSSSTPGRPATARRRPPARRWRSSAPAPTASSVFAFEGEGGLTAGASHETKNSAWGLGLDNLIYVRRLERLRHRHQRRSARSSTARRTTGSARMAGASSASSTAATGSRSRAASWS